MAVISLGIAAKITLFKDSLAKSADKLGVAVVNSDLSTVWSFVSQDDRQLYSITEVEFHDFWGQFISPKIKSIHKFNVVQASENGLTLQFKDEKVASPLLLIVSGNEGEYYSPYILSMLCNYSAQYDYHPKDPNSGFIDLAKHFSGWYRENKSRLSECGIRGLKTGIDKEYRSIDEYVSACEIYVKSNKKK